ncbi:efflux RND transporter periplasmic adaptor subunit [Singulisphaera sp. PoT]|uniref:efflux RND transporter periplasmic adaptor subunit n=1 Tax=Singulisphaera sp. PoT TaxID=3411797 RepID=UPI003BF5BD36
MILRDQDSRSVLRPASRMALILGVAALLALPGWAPGEPPEARKPAEAPQEKAPGASKPAEVPQEKAPETPTPAPSEKGTTLTPNDPRSAQGGPKGGADDATTAYDPFSNTGAPRPKLIKAAVFHPLVQEVSDYIDFRGWFEVDNKVEIRAETSGRLERAMYRTGAVVKKGQILFEIDAGEYEIEVTKAKAEHQKDLARLERMKSTLENAKSLQKRNMTSQLDIANHESNFAEAQAECNISLANLRLAERRLESTRVRAPIGGKVGRPLLAPGSLVLSNITPLASIISIDTMWVEFEAKTNTFRYLVDVRSKQMAKGGSDNRLLALVRLSPDDVELGRGYVDLDDNEVNSVEGTFRLRVALPNHDHHYLPGMKATVRLVTSDPHRETILPVATIANSRINRSRFQPALIGSGADQNFQLFVLNEKDEVEIREIVGHFYQGHEQGHSADAFVVTKGLSANDRVVFDHMNDSIKPPGNLFPGVGPASEVRLDPISKMFSLFVQGPGQGDAKAAEPKR